jgi:hypothetical protein
MRPQSSGWSSGDRLSTSRRLHSDLSDIELQPPNLGQRKYFVNWHAQILHSYSPLSCCCFAMLNTQVYTAVYIKTAWEMRKNAKICDLPACRVKKRDVELFKCRRCQVATYCCHEHHVEHWPAHMSLCKEVQRRCDHSGCENRAEVKCPLCNVATYCSEEHRSAHKSAHRSRCTELRGL